MRRKGYKGKKSKAACQWQDHTQIPFTLSVFPSKPPLGFLFNVTIPASKSSYSIFLWPLPHLTCLYFLLRVMNLVLLNSSIYSIYISNYDKVFENWKLCLVLHWKPNTWFHSCNGVETHRYFLVIIYWMYITWYSHFTHVI